MTLLKCPHCPTEFTALMANMQLGRLPDLAPILCGNCLQVSLIHNRVVRAATEVELRAIQQSEAWETISKARNALLHAIAPAPEDAPK